MLTLFTTDHTWIIPWMYHLQMQVKKYASLTWPFLCQDRFPDQEFKIIHKQSLFKLSFCDCISFNELFTPCSKQLLANFRSSTQRVVFPSPRWKWKLLLTLGLECLRGEWWGIQSESFCRLTEFAASKLSESGRLPCLLCLFYLSVDTQINVRNTNQSSLPRASSVKVALLVRLSICSMSRNIMWSTKNWFDTSRSTKLN